MIRKVTMGILLYPAATSPLQNIVYGGTLNNFHVTDIEAMVPTVSASPAASKGEL